jgi:beta-galactosidase
LVFRFLHQPQYVVNHHKPGTCGFVGNLYHYAEVSDNAAKVMIRTTVKNAGNITQKVKVVQELVNATGGSVRKTEGLLELKSDSAKVVSQTLSVAKPTLWSIDNPCLYKIITKLYIEGKQVDEFESSLGIRSFTFDIQNGFILNGETRIR